MFGEWAKCLVFCLRSALLFGCFYESKTLCQYHSFRNSVQSSPKSIFTFLHLWISLIEWICSECDWHSNENIVMENESHFKFVIFAILNSPLQYFDFVFLMFFLQCISSCKFDDWFLSQKLCQNEWVWTMIQLTSECSTAKFIHQSLV